MCLIRSCLCCQEDIQVVSVIFKVVAPLEFESRLYPF